MAIVHIAMADAVSAIGGGFSSYTGVKNRAHTISMELAISQAAHDTLIALFPSQAASFDTFLEADLARVVATKQQRGNARDLGSRIAAAVLAMRANDGSQIPSLGLALPGKGVISPDIGGRIR